jgi:transcriptional regulator with GAF, ATPase, and Fis domain
MTSSAPNHPDATRARYETLLEVAQSIADHHHLSTLFGELSRCLKRLVSFDFISLTLVDPKARVVRLHVLETDEPVDIVPGAIPFADTPTMAALETRRPYYVADIREEVRFPIIRDLLQGHGIRSFCILPLFTAQRDIGGLHFGSVRENSYSPVCGKKRWSARSVRGGRRQAGADAICWNRGAKCLDPTDPADPAEIGLTLALQPAYNHRQP